MPTGIFIELDTPVQAVGKFLGYARALVPAFLPQLKTMLPDLVKSHFPVLGPVMALEGNFDLGKFVTGLLKKRIAYVNMPESVIRDGVRVLEFYGTPTEPQQTA